MISTDLDGTILNYGWTDTGVNVVNWAVVDAIAELARQRNQSGITIVSNQGGIPFWVKTGGQGHFPAPMAVAERCAIAAAAFASRDVHLRGTHISVYHPKAAAADIWEAVIQTTVALQHFQLTCECVYHTSASRKPSPMMLWSTRAQAFFGDSDEDEGAAAAAHIIFHRVPRFTAEPYFLT